MKIIDVIQKITDEIGQNPQRADTCDGLKTGEEEWPVTSIVVTFTASVDVIRQAINLGANLIITHEPTFYNHLDRTEWLEHNKTYQYKQRLLLENKIAVWRFHDQMHFTRPDMILQGFVNDMGWSGYQDPAHEKTFHLPENTVEHLISTFQKKLGIESIRVVGDLKMTYRSVACSLGAVGGDTQMDFWNRHDCEVFICGETAEWQTCEYVRDAMDAGERKALIILGHIQSEEAGMRYLSRQIGALFSDISINFVPVSDPFKRITTGGKPSKAF